MAAERRATRSFWADNYSVMLLGKSGFWNWRQNRTPKGKPWGSLLPHPEIDAIRAMQDGL